MTIHVMVADAPLSPNYATRVTCLNFSSLESHYYEPLNFVKITILTYTSPTPLRKTLQSRSVFWYPSLFFHFHSYFINLCQIFRAFKSVGLKRRDGETVFKRTDLPNLQWRFYRISWNKSFIHFVLTTVHPYRLFLYNCADTVLRYRNIWRTSAHISVTVVFKPKHCSFFPFLVILPFWTGFSSSEYYKPATFWAISSAI